VLAVAEAVGGLAGLQPVTAASAQTAASSQHAQRGILFTKPKLSKVLVNLLRKECLVDEGFPIGMSRTTPALVQLLARSGSDRLADAFADAGLTGMRPLHAPLLVPLLAGGRRASDLAASLRVTRQAVAQVVDVLERDGYVERIADPGDGRAKLVCLTRRGRAALRVMRATALTIEQEWEVLLGPERLDDFRETLAFLLTG
jgi:DNA-binding MarR family transcriptional regulator